MDRFRLGNLEGTPANIENYRYQLQEQLIATNPVWSAISGLGNNGQTSNFPAQMPNLPVLVQPIAEVPSKEIEKPVNDDSNNVNEGEVGEVDEASETVPDADYGYIPKEYICQYCNEKSPFLYAYSEHLRVYHNVERPFICPETGCDKDFIKRKSLECHLRDFHRKDIKIIKRNFKIINGRHHCDICDKSFATIAAVSIHRFFHFEPRFSCIQCDKKFHILKLLKRHLKRHKVLTRRSKYDCENCDKQFINWEDYEQHQCKSGKKPSKVRPPHPSGAKRMPGNRGKRGRPAGSRNRGPSTGLRKCDLTRRFNLSEKEYLCETCGAGYRQSQSLRAHIDRDHSDNTCKICSTDCGSPEKLLVHLKETHNQQPPAELVNKIVRLKKLKRENTCRRQFLCEVCSEVYKGATFFNNHMTVHYQEELSRQCPVCKSQFSSKDELNSHLASTHEDVDLSQVPPLTLPECDVCHFKFKTQDALNDHTKTTHPFKEDKVCPYCGKRFAGTKAKNYLTHVQTHVNLKRHVCPHCGKGFALKCNFLTHMEVNHLRTNPLYCRQCRVLFLTEEKHQEHLDEKHIDKYKFVCKLCYWGFNDHDKYLFHRRYGHRQDLPNKLKPYVCDFCSKRYVSFHGLLKHCSKCEMNVDKILPTPSKRAKVTTTTKEVTLSPVVQEFICKDCHFVFETMDNCHQHLISVHKLPRVNLDDNTITALNKKDENYKYGVFDQFLAEKDNSVFKKLPFFCKVCRIFYISRKGFDRHVRDFHTIIANEGNSGTDGRTSPQEEITSEDKSMENEDADDFEEDESELDEDEHDDNNSIISLTSDVLLEDFDSQDELSDSDDESPSESDFNDLDGPVPNYYRCNVCAKLLSSWENVKKHYRKLHPLEKIQRGDRLPVSFSSLDLFVCKICKLPYKSQSGILTHFENKHKDVKIPKGTVESYRDNLNAYLAVGKMKDLNKILYEIDKERRVNERGHVAKDVSQEVVPEVEKTTSRDNASTSHEQKTNPKFVAFTSCTIFICKMCKLPYKSQSGILKHFDSKHKDVQIPKGMFEYHREELKPYIAIGDLSDFSKMLQEIDEERKMKERGSVANEVSLEYEQEVEKTASESESNDSISDDDQTSVNRGITPSENSEEIDDLSNPKVNLKTTKSHVEINGTDEEKADLTLLDEYTTEQLKNSFVTLKKYTCKVCSLGWGKSYHLDNHIAKWHPDYYNIYPRDETEVTTVRATTDVTDIDSFVKAVMEDVSKAEQKAKETEIITRRRRRPRKTKPQEENFNNKEHDGTTEDNVSVCDSSNRAEKVSNTNKQPQDQQILGNFTHPAIQSLPINASNASVIQIAPERPEKQSRVPVTSGEDLLQNMVHSTVVPNNNISLTINNQNVPYNHQLYQNYLSSFDNQLTATNQNQVFPTSSLEFPQGGAKEIPFSDWDNIFVSPVKNKNVPATTTTTNLTDPFNQNFGQNYHPGMSSFQNQPVNHHQDPGLMINLGPSGLHQPYLNSSIPSTSHLGHPPSYSNFVTTQNHLIPGTNYEGAALASSTSTLTLIGDKRIPVANEDSDGDDSTGNVNDTGFEINYDSESSCDNPNEKTVPSKPTRSELKSNKNDAIAEKEKEFQNNYVQFIKRKKQVIEDTIAPDIPETRMETLVEPSLLHLLDEDEDSDEIPPLTAKELEEARSKVHLCKFCPMYYEKTRFLLSHYKRKHRDEAKDLIAELEKVESVRKSDGTYNCKFCDKKPKDYKALQNHIRDFHKGKNFKCNLCDAAFARKITLDRHLETHKDEYLYSCKVCDMKFKTYHSFSHHKRYKHLELRPFSCDKCKRPFSSEKLLAEHRENICSKSRKCTVCGETFEGRRELTKHMYTHEDNRMECPMCPKKFVTEKYLKLHLKEMEKNGGVCKRKQKRNKRQGADNKASDSDEDTQSSSGSSDSEQEMNGNNDQRKKKKSPAKRKSNSESDDFSTSDSDSEFEPQVKKKQKVNTKKQTKTVKKSVSIVSRPSRASKPKFLKEIDDYD